MLGEPALYIVRHGETDLNAGNKFRGFMDVDLDDNGKDQAREARNLLASVPLAAIYASDLSRATETADIINQKHKLKVQHVAAGRPWHVGKFAGKSKTEINKRALQSYADTPDVAVPDGESLNEFRQRYRDLFDRKIAESMELGGPVLIVGHASNAHEVGNIVYDDIDALDVDPGGIIAVYITRDGLSARVIKGKAEDKSEGYGKS